MLARENGDAFCEGKLRGTSWLVGSRDGCKRRFENGNKLVFMVSRGGLTAFAGMHYG